MERGNGLPKEREVDMSREVCEWEGCGLGEDVADLRFELGVESSAAVTELLLVVFRMLNSLKLQKRRFFAVSHAQ